MKYLLLLFFVPFSLLGETMIKLDPYDYYDPVHQERLFDGIQLLLMDVTLEKDDGSVPFVEINNLVQVTVLPFDGVIAIRSRSGVDPKVSETVCDQFVAQAERAKRESIMDAADLIRRQAEHMRRRVDLKDKEDPDYMRQAESYRHLLAKLRDTVKGETPEFAYTWTIIESQPVSDGNAEKPPGVEREP